MTRALTADQIATCDRDGHLFRWVRAWHSCGFYECERCGETKPQERLTLPAAVAEISLGPDGMRIGFDAIHGCDLGEGGER